MKLIAVMYVEGTNQITLSDEIPVDIITNNKMGTWGFGRERYRINRDIRVPEGGERWGVMAILGREGNAPLLLGNVNQAVEELGLQWNNQALVTTT